jgi:prolipoprotein diacylglyceryltransferase
LGCNKSFSHIAIVFFTTAGKVKSAKLLKRRSWLSGFVHIGDHPGRIGNRKNRCCVGLLVFCHRIRHAKRVIRHFVFRVAGREPILLCKAIPMYKFVLLFLVLVILTVFSLAIKARSENLEVSSPPMLGSPVVVLNY